MIKIRDIHKSFGDLEVLRGVDIDVAKGEVVAILGSSGSGKSTLLRCINFLERASKGSIEIGDLRVDAALATPAEVLDVRMRTAMVFQSFNLFKNLNVLENITIGLTDVRKTPKEQARKEAEALLEIVGMQDRLKSLPTQLSGGQQQRVAIARALALKPELLLFDEPTSALDPELADDVLTCIKDVAEQGNTMLLVTHEIGFAYEVADRIVLLDEGIIIESGETKGFFHNPQTERGKLFLGKAMKRFILTTDFIPTERGEYI